MTGSEQSKRSGSYSRQSLYPDHCIRILSGMPLSDVEIGTLFPAALIGSFIKEYIVVI